jgi:hypothetical protein
MDMTKSEIDDFFGKTKILNGHDSNDLALDISSAKTPEFYEDLIKNNSI